MKLILLNKNTFSSKKGDEYVSIDSVDYRTGKVEKLVFTKKDFEILDVKLPDFQENPDFLDSIKSLETYDVSFNSRGRVETLVKSK